MKRILLLTISTLLLTLLTACAPSAAPQESFFCLPKASEEYQSLERCLTEVLNSGFETTFPVSGTYTEPVVVYDVDGDGQDEAVAFFRNLSGGETPLRVCFFRQNEDQEYHLLTYLEGTGSNINSITFAQMVGKPDSKQEIVISWQISRSVYSLAVYSTESGAAEQIMDSTVYTRYQVADLNDDGKSELVVLQGDATDTAIRQAEYYADTKGRLELQNTVPLSKRMGTIERVNVGLLSNGQPGVSNGETALFVTGYVEGADDGVVNWSYQVTDILMVQHGELTSLVMGEQGTSRTTRNGLAADQDINGDGLWEIPAPIQLSKYDPDSDTAFYGVNWNQYTPDGTPVRVSTCYFNNTDGWYFEIDPDWLAHLQLARADTVNGNTVERGVMLYYVRSSGEDPEPVAAIYKNTGNNRESNGVVGDKLLLMRNSSAVYSIKLFNGAERLGLTTEEARTGFHLIQTSWQEN